MGTQKRNRDRVGGKPPTTQKRFYGLLNAFFISILFGSITFATVLSFRSVIFRGCIGINRQETKPIPDRTMNLLYKTTAFVIVII